MPNSSSDTNGRPDRALRIQALCALLVALSAAYVSYRHGREFALCFGADATTATLWPLIVDGLLLIATIELWKTSHQHHATGQWKAWLSFTLGIALSLGANIASAPKLVARQTDPEQHETSDPMGRGLLCTGIGQAVPVPRQVRTCVDVAPLCVDLATAGPPQVEHRRSCRSCQSDVRPSEALFVHCCRATLRLAVATWVGFDVS